MPGESTGTKRTMENTFEYGNFIADFYTNSTPNVPPIFHYIVTRKGLRQIIHWGQEYSREEAQAAALAVLQELSNSFERVS